MDTNPHSVIRSYRHVNLWLALICAVLLALVLLLVLHNTIRDIRARLDLNASYAQDEVQNILLSAENVLKGYRAYFRTVDFVDYRKLEEYSRSIRAQYTHIHMTQYMIRVPRDRLNAFVNERIHEGYATYRINEFNNREGKRLVPVAERDVYYPLVFMDPMQVRSLSMLGFDAYSHPLMREAIDLAVRSGKSRATQPFELYNGETGYMVIEPVFTTDALPEEPDARAELATRLVAVFVGFDDLLRNIEINRRTSIALSYRDENDGRMVQVSSRNRDAIEHDSIWPVFESSHRMALAGRTFRLNMQRQLSWEDLDFDWFGFALITMAAFSLLLFNFVHLRIRSAMASQHAQAELFREREHAQVTLHSISEAVITTDVDRHIVYMNPIAVRLTGWSDRNAIGRPLESIFRLLDENTREPVDSTVRECLESQSTVLFEQPAILVNKNGDEFAVENTASPLRSHSGEIIGSVLVFRNITHIRNLSRKMEFQAKHDALTELLNRHEFERQLKIAVNSAREEDREHALCYLDLDQFKIINDTCGHIAGDQLLREIARLMPYSIRASDCLARLGGDEFGVLMFDCPLKQAERIADNLRAAVRDFTFSWDRKTFDIGVSIGLVPIRKDSGSLQDVLRRADTACYIAKDHGRNRVHIFTPDDVEISRRHGELQWVSRIRKALQDNRFQLALQAVRPISQAYTEVHYEVLLRMEDTGKGTIPPMSFIPAAERYDMMPVLDKWVIRSTFRMMRDELDHGRELSTYNINLSGQTLCDTGIFDFVRLQIEEFGIPAEHLCFEITETAVIANLSLAIDFIRKMKQLGCRFALDDFGSGLSSFTYLKKLPVDFLKIDGAFVQDIVNDPMDRAIVSAINDIGHEIGLITVAEYVEDEGVLELLKELGVDYVQGYGVEKPIAWSSGNVIQFKAV